MEENERKKSEKEIMLPPTKLFGPTHLGSTFLFFNFTMQTEELQARYSELLKTSSITTIDFSRMVFKDRPMRIDGHLN